jgi:hypothetical protein
MDHRGKGLVRSALRRRPLKHVRLEVHISVTCSILVSNLGSFGLQETSDKFRLEEWFSGAILAWTRGNLRLGPTPCFQHVLSSFCLMSPHPPK